MSKQVISEENVKMVPFNTIAVDEDFNSRRKLRDIPELASSIEQNGLLSALVVSNGGEGAKPYNLAAGFRRYAALKMLGYGSKLVPVIVRDSEDAVINNLVENVERDDLHPLDLAERIHNLVAGEYPTPKGVEPKAWDKDELASKLGLSKTTINNYIRTHDKLCAEAGKLLRDGDAPRPPQKLLFSWLMIENEEEQVATVQAWLETQKVQKDEPKKRGGKKKQDKAEKTAFGLVSKKNFELINDNIKVLQYKLDNTKAAVEKGEFEAQIKALRWVVGKTEYLPGLKQEDWDAVFPPLPDEDDKI